MKNKSLKLRSSYFFRQRKRFYSRDSSKHMPELVKPESERTESLIEDILRWADDGGRTLSQTGYPLPQVAETKTPRLMDAAEEYLL
ncbi:MAG TPA: hypothetical protein VN843_11165 [Anaerolineales bacterium]|nr:hypothetical protein [Anaerolineales bacterium]